MVKSTTQISPDATEPELTISPEKVCFLVIKAREFDAKELPNDTDPGSNPSDDQDIEVLEDQPDDPVVEEMTSLIESLSQDEQIDLVALAWLGRDDNTAANWLDVRADAANAYNPRTTARYLLGTPQLGDLLEEGLALLGRSCEDFELNRL